MSFLHIDIAVDEREIQIGISFFVLDRKVYRLVVEEWNEPAVSDKWRPGDDGAPEGLLSAAYEYTNELDLEELGRLERGERG